MGFRKQLLKLSLSTYVGSLALVGRRDAVDLHAQIVEDYPPTVSVNTKRGVLTFVCPGREALREARNFANWEPETIAWIDSFESNAVFWDCGANIGWCSLYAALASSASVMAFEPSAFNYSVLMRNIQENRFDDKVFALCAALSDRTRKDYFFMQYTQVGGAKNAFGEASWWGGASPPNLSTR